MVDTAPPPRRRWFRFSLRTLFIAITLFAVWLGSELRFVEKRRQFSSDGSAEGVWKRAWVLESEPTCLFTKAIPPWRRLFGDEAAAFVICRTEAHAKDARRLFPEAAILFRDDAQKLHIWFRFANLGEMVACRTILEHSIEQSQISDALDRWEHENRRLRPTK
jgi:hypothetical protein